MNLNGQAPIQAYARVIGKREIRISSIDHGRRMIIRTLDELLDYRQPGSHFALAKAALALAGFAPEAADWPAGIRTLDGMPRHFRGGKPHVELDPDRSTPVIEDLRARTRPYVWGAKLLGAAGGGLLLVCKSAKIPVFQQQRKR